MLFFDHPPLHPVDHFTQGRVTGPTLSVGMLVGEGVLKNGFIEVPLDNPLQTLEEETGEGDGAEGFGAGLVRLVFGDKNYLHVEEGAGDGCREDAFAIDFRD